MEENFGTRLKVFMESEGMTSSQFADLCEIPRPSFSQLLSGRNQKVSDVLIGKIHTVFPDLSIMWLMFGEGEMLISSSKKNDTTAIKDETQNSEEKIALKSGILSGNGQQTTEYGNVGGLNKQPIVSNTTIFQQLEESKKIMELQEQIDNLQKNPRKVIQVTVYYDDSTYETFTRKP